MSAWPPIDRDDLRAAAGTAGFDMLFPVLIRRLIAETASGLASLDVPGGSGTSTGGFDGVATTGAATTFVPAGTSVWELSVEQKPAKADDDYDKRTEAPDGLPTSDVTYVQVLLAPWRDARSWASDRAAQGRWRDVLAYNLDRVDAWLETAPATTAWLAARLGKALPGVFSVWDWWQDTWLPSTRVPLDTAIVLAGREAAADAFLASLEAGLRLVSVSGDLRPEEFKAFVAAALSLRGELDNTTLATRTLFVSDATSLRQLVAQRQPMLLVLSDASLARDLPASHPHQLIVAAARGAQGNVQVPRIDGQVAAAQLLASGVVRDDAEELGTLARRSLLALRRALAHQPEPLTPEWALAPDMRHRRLLLVGSWSSDNSEDRRVVSQLLGVSADRVEELAISLAAGTDIPFLAHTNELWHLPALDDAWSLLGGSLTADDLTTLRPTIFEVLGELDPRLDLEPEQRWRAGIDGVGPRFSSSLRTGLAQTLAALGAGRADIQLGRGTTPVQWVRSVVRELLTRANADSGYRLWRSLGDVLSLIAEAAPAEFLEAMQAGLVGPSPLHQEMFAEAQDDPLGFGAGAAHTPFLWALEVVAWLPDHVDEAVEMLASLAELDPGGRLSNRPLASLVGILSAWCPNTTVTTDHRIRMLERLARRHPALAVKLLRQLIPDGHDIQTAHARPKFRDVNVSAQPAPAEIQRVVEAAADLLIKHVESDLTGCLDLVEKIDDLPPQCRLAAATLLIEHAGELADDSRTTVYEALRETISRHREHADAYWALPQSELDDLQAACDALAPARAVLRHAWLFRSDWVTLGDGSRVEDFTAYEAELNSRRVLALGEVLAEEGLDGVVELASHCGQSHLVGAALGQLADDHDQQMLVWLEQDESPRRDVAAAALGQRLQAEGLPLLDRLLESTEDPRAQARLLRFTRDPAIAWPRLPELGDEVTGHYWREFNYFGLGNFPQAMDAARSLLTFGRPAAALDLIVLYRRKQPPTVEVAEVVASALEVVLADGVKDPEFGRLSAHEFRELFALLAEHREVLGLDRIVRLEWQYFPALGFDATSPTLQHSILQDPAIFVELVAWCFRPAASGTAKEHEASSEQDDRGRAIRAYEVLRSIKTCPGMTAESGLDAAALRDWVDRAREGFAAVDRTEIGDSRIGELLAFAPADPDGALIPLAVRDLLEDLRSERIERGLAIGIHNKRGVTSRGLLDGGAQEWALARKYREQADAATPWPRTRKVLLGLAESYEIDARREDEEAERRRQGLGG